MIERSCQGRRSRSPSACSATPPRSCPSWCGAACGPTWSPTRPPRTIRSTAICRRAGRSAEWEARARAAIPKAVEQAAQAVDGACTCAAMLDFHERGRADARLRQQHPPDGARTRASTNAFDFPGFVPAYIRPLFCRGIGPFRWAALSGDPEDIYKTDAKVKELMPGRHAPAPLARHGARAHRLPGPAGAHLLGRPGRPRTGSASPSTRWWRSGELKAPIVIGRDHLDSGSVASPNRETEAMRDGSDAVSDWPLLNALLNCASRRDLGVAASRRRRRHGLLAARRHGDRVRRHAGRRRGGSSACCGTTRRPA